MYKRWLIALFVLLSLYACTSKEDSLRQLFEFEQKNTLASLNALETNLKNNTLENARLLDAYAKQLKELMPEYATLIDAVQRNAEPSGPMYRSLTQRLADVKPGNSIGSLQEGLDELQSIAIAAQPLVFNDALSDSVNVLSDMSDGKLPRVQASSLQAQQKMTGSEYAAPGTQFIGNPQYGSWQPGPDGDMIWKWALAYILFDNILDRNYGFNRSYYNYSRWSSRRPYSYYHDYGRTYYSSPRQLSTQMSNEDRVAKSFASQGKRFNSPYARKAPGGGSLSAASKSSGSFRTNSSFKKSASTFSSSTRSSTTRIARGPRLGK